MSWLMWFVKLFFLNIIGPMNCGLHTCYGDGTEISNTDNKHIRDVTWKNMVFNRWRKGDIIMIDNYRISHGRQVKIYSTVHIYVIQAVLFLQPYTGKRSIVVAWSKPYLRPSLCEKRE